MLDDIIVWWHAGDDGADVFDVMPNASNTDRVRDGDRWRGDDRTGAPCSPCRARRRSSGSATVFPEAAAVGRFRVAGAEWQGAPCDVAGTGYTGERGVEIAVPADGGGGRCGRRGRRRRHPPAGLGARDTLRLEAALPLHGHELGPGITPLQAGLGWVVAWDKPDVPRAATPCSPSARPACHRHSSASPPRAAAASRRVPRPRRRARTSAW